MPCRESICLFGPTGSGKTVQVGELALDRFLATGGSMDEAGKLHGGRLTRLYTGDQGGWSSIQPLVDVGIIKVVDMRPYLGTLWEAWDKASKGYVPTASGWVQDVDGIDIFAFEGMTTIGDLLLKDMREGNAAGTRVIKGRGQDVAIRQGDYTFLPTNETMYGYAQARLLDLILQSQALIPGDFAFTIWTALAYRAQDQDDMSVILGPQAAGKKLASDLPAKVTYTFRLQDLPADPNFGRPAPEHRLYIDAYKDDDSPGVAKVVGNSRVPLEALSVIPAGGFISPANLPKALELIKSGGEVARKAISARLRQAYRVPVKEAMK